MTKVDFESISDIKQELKILRLKKDISLELLESNKYEMENYMQPLSLVNKLLGPLKKMVLGYLLKKLFK
ncbi:hypothetical protein GTQ34_07460 [Muricauda sp. JGD-17]|uniref:Glutaminyl-tRNA synthetase n=1 Tax=Flagellimonas ochracea TaxID=2696472 RepID=A0A964WXM5_9FLAO|nr:hypothetical protein [Allomuricauda ochracea]NAY91749.1 hypothetical protein [Allomuricauda ochracea]